MGKIGREQGRFDIHDRDQANRPKIQLYMGQGLVGYLGRVIFESMEFSTCSPVVFFNKFTGMGGLYHFPAGSAKALGSTDGSHLAFMLAMAESIEATDIWVHSGGHSIEEAKEPRRRDSDSSSDDKAPKELSLADQRAILVQEFKNELPDTNIHEGIGRGTISVTLGNVDDQTGIKSIHQETDVSMAPNYDLADVDPPNYVIRFGFANAGQQWVS